MSISVTIEDISDRPLEGVVDAAIKQSDGERVSVRDVFEAWGDRSYGPMFILLGVFGGTPLSVLPGMASVAGIIIFLLAVQMAFGKKHPWLPAFILNRSFSEKKLRAVRKKIEKPLIFIDRMISARFVALTGSAMRRFAAVVLMGLGAIMVPMDALPFVVAAPSWAVAIFGVAITARDGLAMSFALAATLGVGVLAYQVLL